ncbi:hypothetical protein CRYUN_Cryun09bG0002300 [Craigia yunnanensis]
MSNPDEPTKNNHAGSPATTSSPTTYVENPTPGVGFGVSAFTRRWKREDLLKRGSLLARGLALLFSLLSFIIMASNKHGDWKIFDKHGEYSYLLAIAILSILYTGRQALRHRYLNNVSLPWWTFWGSGIHQEMNHPWVRP